MTRVPWGRETMAGLAGAIGSVPDGMATAVLAGANPMAGLYASFAGPAAGGLLQSTTVMVVATTSAAAVTTAEVMNAGPADPIRTLATLTILAGAFMLLATRAGVRQADAVRVRVGDGRVHVRRRADPDPRPARRCHRGDHQRRVDPGEGPEHAAPVAVLRPGLDAHRRHGDRDQHRPRAGEAGGAGPADRDRDPHPGARRPPARRWRRWSPRRGRSPSACRRWCCPTSAWSPRRWSPRRRP